MALCRVAESALLPSADTVAPSPPGNAVDTDSRCWVFGEAGALVALRGVPWLLSDPPAGVTWPSVGGADAGMLDTVVFDVVVALLRKSGVGCIEGAAVGVGHVGGDDKGGVVEPSAIESGGLSFPSVGAAIFMRN